MHNACGLCFIPVIVDMERCIPEEKEHRRLFPEFYIPVQDPVNGAWYHRRCIRKHGSIFKQKGMDYEEPSDLMYFPDDEGNGWYPQLFDKDRCDLLAHLWEVVGFTDDDIIPIVEWVARAMSRVQIDQGSPKWYIYRLFFVTCSELEDVARCQGRTGKLVRTKIKPSSFGDNNPFLMPECMYMGSMAQKYLIIRYESIYNTWAFEPGLMSDPITHAIAGSTDSITNTGIVIETKYPERRGIDPAPTIYPRYRDQVCGYLSMIKYADTLDYIEGLMYPYDYVLSVKRLTKKSELYTKWCSKTLPIIQQVAIAYKKLYLEYKRTESDELLEEHGASDKAVRRKKDY